MRQNHPHYEPLFDSIRAVPFVINLLGLVALFGGLLKIMELIFRRNAAS